MKYCDTKEYHSYMCSLLVTTVLNFTVFYLGTYVSIHWLIANTLAWMITILVSYILNFHVILKRPDIGKEIIEFIGLHGITFFIETVVLYLTMYSFSNYIIICKAIVNILIVLISLLIYKAMVLKSNKA